MSAAERMKKYMDSQTQEQRQDRQTKDRIQHRAIRDGKSKEQRHDPQKRDPIRHSAARDDKSQEQTQHRLEQNCCC